MAERLGVAGIDWYVEGDVFAFPTDVLPATLGKQARDDQGFAMFGSASFYLGKTVWLVQAKRYY